jgi:hypothetical protein
MDVLILTPVPADSCGCGEDHELIEEYTAVVIVHEGTTREIIITFK